MKPELEPQDHPTEPLLEANLVQSKQIGDETNGLLETLVQQNHENNPEPLLEAQLVTLDKIAKNTDGSKPVRLAEREEDNDDESFNENEAGKALWSMLRGPKGAKGDKGDQGEKGDKGEDSTVEGPQGIQGEQGEKGEQGIAGIDGKDGRDGRDGLDGIDGKDGLNGKDGKDGKDLSSDPEISKTVKSLKKQVSNLASSVTSNMVTYRVDDVLVSNGAVLNLKAGTNVTLTPVTDNDGASVTIDATGTGGASTFLALTDTPSTYTGQALKILQVNAGETSLELVPLSGGGDALTANPLSQFAATTSAQLAGVLSDETGSGSAVFATSPTLVTPTLGVATATSVNKVALTAPATGATITATDGTTTTLSGGTHSGTNTGDQDLSSYQVKPSEGAFANGDKTKLDGIEASADVTDATNVSAAGAQMTSGKDATGGYAGLTLFKINFKNAANTFTNFLTNATTAARTWTFPDKDGTVAMTSDITGTNSGTNTGDQTSIVGITGTKAQFDTAVSDGNIMYDGDSITNATATADRIFYSNNSGVITELALGASGTFLKSNGATSAPTFDTPAGSGDVTKVGTPVDNQIGVWTGSGTIEGDSSLTWDASSLIIDKTGTEALLVRKDADVGDVLTVNTTNARVMIGTPDPNANGAASWALGVSGNILATANIGVSLFTADSTAGGLSSYKARGTQASPTATQADDYLMMNTGRGYGSTGFPLNSKGAMSIRASQNWTDANQGTYIGFETTPDNSTTRAERVKITSLAVIPTTNDAITLGNTTNQFSDLFLASGGVINFNNGNATLTHSAGLLTSNVDIVVPAEAYAVGWNGSNEAPTKNDVYDQMELKAPLASPTFTGTVTLPTGLTGVIRTDSGVVSVDTDVTDIVSAASDTAAGKVELATITETNTGTDATRALTPDALAGSNFGIRYVALTLNATTALTTSDIAYFRIPAAYTGMNLISVSATVGTGAAGSSSSGTPTFTVKNVTDGNQMLSTSLTVDATEYTSATATTAAVINASFDDVVTDDLIEVAVTTAGTGVTYATITLGFQLP